MKRSLLTSALGVVVAASMISPAFASDTPKQPKKTVDVACIQKAVTDRDGTISAALQIVVAAVTKRGQDLSAAWAQTDPAARKAAVKNANTAFNGVWKTFNATRKNAWTKYKATAPNCKVPVGDAGSAGQDSGSM